jgi:hypothetical protein
MIAGKMPRRKMELYKNTRVAYPEHQRNKTEGRDMSEVILKGASGRLHRFIAYRADYVFPETSAVYCFARPGLGGRGWAPLFLSRTANLGKRMANHESWPEARLLGATHILVHQRDERDVREFVEADLAEALKPIMNGPLFDGLADDVAETAEAGAPNLRLVQAA